MTINNMRRVLSSFFGWLEDEGVQLKSPMRMIKPIKTPNKMKPTFTSGQVERMREATTCIRDLAIIDLLASTGMPIEQVQHLLGHQRIDTTLLYAKVDDANVKISHNRFIC